MKRIRKILFILLFFVTFISVLNCKNSSNPPKFVITHFLPFQFRGMTIPPFGIFVKNKSFLEENWFVDHENFHWKQYQDLGLFQFYLKYFYFYIKFGYFDNPMEVEAREKGEWKNAEID